METRAGSAAGSRHCSGHCLCLPSRPWLLQSCSVPGPEWGLELGGRGAGYAAQQGKMPRKHHLVQLGGLQRGG